MARLTSLLTATTAFTHVGRALRLGSAALAVCILPFQSASAQSPAPAKQDAASSLRSILQDAVDQGLLDTKSSTPPAAAGTNSDVKRPQPLVKMGSEQACKLAAQAEITAFGEVTGFEYITAAKAKLGNEDAAPEDMRAIILSYLALGLGTEALAISERTDEGLLALMSRIVEGHISPADAARLKDYADCRPSFQVWARAAEILQPNASVSTPIISEADFAALSDFPPKLKEQMEIDFAIHAAKTGDTLSAKRLLTKLAPNTKHGDLPARKDENLLFLHALMLQSKNDDRFAEIFTHIASGTGRYKSEALKALADDAAQTGRSLPAEFEDNLNALGHQYGEGQEAKLAAIELVKFRLGQNQFSDAINTAKAKFGPSDIMRPESVSLIGDKLSTGFSSGLSSRRLYALNGYFHDPDFFDSYPEVLKLALQAHSAAIDLSLPELAHQLTPKLQAFAVTNSDNEIKNSLYLAEAQLAFKTANYNEAVSVLNDITPSVISDKLRRDAALASGDRALTQSVLGSLPASDERDSEYLEFVLQQGLWAESKMQAQTILAKEKIATQSDNAPAPAEAEMPFAFSLELLDYLTAPIALNLKDKFPDNSKELDALLLTFKSNSNVAKGFLNYDSSPP